MPKFGKKAEVLLIEKFQSYNLSFSQKTRTFEDEQESYKSKQT